MATREEKEAARKARGNGGTGEGGAPAEVSAPEQQPGNPLPDAPAEPVTGGADRPLEILPDALATPAVARGFDAMSLDELKNAQEVAHWAVDAAEKRLVESISVERSIEHARCLRYQSKAKEQGKKRAFFMLDGKRTTIKKRSNSELLMFVSAEVEDAIEA